MTVSLYDSILCRLCCEENASGIILYNNDSNSGVDLCSMINSYLPIKVEDDGKHPRTICPGCNLQLHSTVQFFDLLIEGQKKIRQLWKEQVNREKRREKQQQSLLISKNRPQLIQPASQVQLNLPPPSNSCNEQPVSIAIQGSEAVVSEGFDLYSATAAALFQATTGHTSTEQQSQNSHQLVAADQDELDDLQFDQVVVVNRGGEGSMYADDHSVVLQVAGLERPRKKRGRPRKQSCIAELQQPDQPEQLEDAAVDSDPPSTGDHHGDGRRRRKRQIPLRFREAVQGKELERILKEEGVTDGEDDKDIMRMAIDGGGDGGGGGEGGEEEEEEGGGDDDDDDECEEGSPKKNRVTTAIAADKEVIGHLETPDGQNLGELIIVNKVSGSSRMARNQKRRIRRRKARFTCDICGRSFMHIGKYRYHKSFHTGIKYECVECKKRFTARENFELHQKMSGHTGEGIVKETEEGVLKESENSGGKVSCEKCNKTFSTKQNLEIHMKAVHEGEKPFECSVCNKRFGYQNSLRCHVLTHHEGGGVNGSGGTDKSGEGVGGFPCDICGRRFNHPSSVVYHKEAEHNDGRRFVCDRCNKAFKHKQLLARHQLVHTNARPHQCATCSSSFKTKANLLSHQATHTGEKRHFCEICGQQFAHKTSLMLHYRWHSGQKPYQCEVCKKMFSQKGNLHEHMRIHTGEKPYGCLFCEKKFTTSSQYKLHMKRHTGERPWKCDACGKAFLHKDTWKCHVRRHNNDKPYKCQLCQRQFSEQWALKKHTRLHTGERPYQCHLCGKAFSDCSNLAKHRKVHERDVNLSEAIMAAAAAAAETASEAAAVDSLADAADAVEYNAVWNATAAADSGGNGAGPDSGDVQQIIYVTYQDPTDPNAKVCEKYLMPADAMMDDDDGGGVDLSQMVAVGESNKGGGATTLQLTDEHGNPLQFTLHNGQLQVGLDESSDNPIQLHTAAAAAESALQSAVISATAAKNSSESSSSYIIKVSPDTAAALMSADGSKLSSAVHGDIPASYAFVIQDAPHKDQLVETFAAQISPDYLNIN